MSTRAARARWPSWSSTPASPPPTAAILPICAAPSCSATGAFMPDYTDIEPGQQLPPLTLPPLSRATLALYAGASGDHNPNHIDSDFARAAGMEDVFAQGMLAMAWLGR